MLARPDLSTFAKSWHSIPQPSLLVPILLLALHSSTAAAGSGYGVERPVVTLQLAYESEDEERTSPTIEDRDEETLTLRQRADIRGGGWLYHPALLDFSFALQPEWKQENTKAPGGFDRDDDNKFLGYFVNATFFKQKLHSLKIFSQHGRDEFDSTLSPDNITETDITRAVWLINHDAFPTSITYEKNETDFQNFFDSRDASDILRIQTNHRTAKSLSLFTTEYVEQERQVVTSDFAIDRFLLNLSNSYRFTENIRLSSSLYGIDSSSELLDSESYIAAERLFIRHSENFRTNYEVRFDKRESMEFSSDTRSVEAGFVHQLYDNLTTTYDANITQDDFTDGKIRVYETDLDFRYIRRIPPGRLTITNGYGYRQEDNNITADISQVINEAVTLTDTQLSFLRRTNIDVDSIIVTDSTQGVIFTEGIDYVVTIVGDTVAIERTLLGGIQDGQEILVDYTFVPRAPFKSDRAEIRFGASLNLWHTLRLYYNASRSKEDLISGTRPSDLMDDTIRRIGGEVRWRWSTTLLEYGDRDTVRTPLTRRRAHQRFSFPLQRGLSTGLFADYVKTILTDTNTITRSRSLGANLRKSIARWGEFEIRAFSREISGDSQNTDSAGILARLGWRFGDWSGDIRYESLGEEDDLTVQTRDRELLRVHVQRIFR